MKEHNAIGLAGRSSSILSSQACSAGSSRLAQAVTLLSLSAWMVPVASSAQDVAGAVLEEVVVTGSRIRGVGPVGSPTLGLDRVDLDRSASTTVADFMKELPQVISVGVAETSFTSSGMSASNISRASAINLRGLGPGATLVLLNGRRHPQSGTAGAFVDASAIPTAAIERVEVVADGASALYGSDAIAGVVNLILRRDFTGAETTLRVNTADSFRRLQFSQLLGHNWGRGRAMFAYEYMENDSLSSAERSFWGQDQRSRGGSDFRQTTCNPGNIILDGVSYAIPASTDGSIDPSTLVPGTRNFCDTSLADIIPRQSRHSGVFYVEQDLTNRVSITAEGFYSRKKLEAQFARQGSVSTFATLNVPSSNAFFVAPPGTSPDRLTVEYSFFPDVGPLSAKGFSETYSGTIEAKIGLSSDWQLNVAASRGQNHDYTFSRTINNAALNAALASSDPQTALNPFGSGTNPAVFDEIFTGQFSPEGRNKITSGEVRADGALFDLTGGTVRLAAGGEFRRYTLETLTTRGSIMAPNRTIKHTDREIVSGYAELFVPLVGSANARNGIRRLEVSIAGRYDDYSDFGDTFNPKVGVTWAPVDTLSLRTTYGTSFRAPTLADLRPPGEANNVTTEVDPLSPTGTSTGITIRAGNPDLGPEEARTFTFGADWQPNAVPQLDVGLTYFAVKYDDRIDGIVLGTALQQETLYADAIIRNPTDEQVQAVLNNGFPLSGVLPPTVAYIVDARPQNRAKTVSKGLDFQVSYTKDVTGLGEFRVGALGTYYTEFDTQQTPTAPVLDRVGVIDYPVRLSARATVGWSSGGFDAGAFLNYVDSYWNVNVAPAQRVSSYTTLDLHLAYRFDAAGSWKNDLRLALNVNNVFDKDPPFVNSFAGYDWGQASPYGRFASLSLTKSW